MGYFSEQSILEEYELEDHSYPSFDSQLLWRLDDLNDRYSELIEQNAPCYGEDHYTNDDYRYAPVECFETLADVARAIEIAKANLECECLVAIDDKDDVCDEIFGDETAPLQLKMFDDTCLYIVPMPQLVAQDFCFKNIFKKFHKTY